ncbi:MAG: MarR family transcriptional regulator [Nanohaloarchaea archaeon]|nr:MarR family transcriptional regulator [Candidatus Nanohaloarchaea archaeon]
MRILIDNTGQGQLEVLGVLTDQQDLRQKDIVRISSLSKGSVSSNVAKLEEKDLIKTNSGILKINREKILSFYREHLENFLIRDKNDPEELNEIRTLTKKEIEEIFETHKEELWSIISKVLSQAGERSDIESINSVFKETDRAIREYVTSKDGSDFKLIAIVTDKSYSLIENLEETDNLKQARNILEEVKE